MKTSLATTRFINAPTIVYKAVSFLRRKSLLMRIMARYRKSIAIEELHALIDQMLGRQYLVLSNRERQLLMDLLRSRMRG